MTLLEVEQRYVDLFDRGRALSLHCSRHFHGESRDRGEAMVDLKRIYEQAGFRALGARTAGFLPVHSGISELPRSCRSSRHARRLRAYFSDNRPLFIARRSRYAAVLQALLVIAGETPESTRKGPAGQGAERDAGPRLGRGTCFRRCPRLCQPAHFDAGRLPRGSAMPSPAYVNTLLFGVYPYVCLVVLLIGSLIRFDREPYTWKSDSSQMLRKDQLRLGSNLFHYGVIVVILGHFAGFLAPTGRLTGRCARRPSASRDGGRRRRWFRCDHRADNSDCAAAGRSAHPAQQPQMGSRVASHAVVAARARPS